MNYPRAYAIATWLKYEKYGEYPNGLSYDDQPIQLMEDWAALDQRFDLIYDGLKADENYVPPGWEAILEDIPVLSLPKVSLAERLKRS